MYSNQHLEDNNWSFRQARLFDKGSMARNNHLESIRFCREHNKFPKPIIP